MQRDETYLVDILESAKIALDYVSGKTWDQFYEDLQCQDAVVRRIEIIGEAAGFSGNSRQVSTDSLARDDQHEKLRYPYDSVDIGQVWDTVQNKFPSLIEELKIVPPEEN